LFSFLCGFSYGRFFIIITTSRTSTMMIKTNRPAIAGTKYVSAVDAGVGVGAVVAAGWSSTKKAF
jgi:hypothetical protein